MSSYVVSSDNIDGKEQSYIQACISKLEAKGHTCENAGVGPNTIQSKGLSSSSSGKIGVFIVGGSDAGMYTDFVTGLKNGYYHYKYMWVVFASNTATTDKWITCSGLASTPLVRAWDDNYSGSNIAAVGKTAKQYFTENKQYINYVCGKKGCDFDSIASKLANGGNDESDEGSSASSIKDAIKEVASFWDGDVEITVDKEKVRLRKIPSPEANHLPLEIIEGENVHLASINIQDFHPDTINTLKVHWQGGEDIVLTDTDLIARFGEKPKEMDAVKLVVKEGEAESTPSTTTVSTASDDTADASSTTDTEDTTSVSSTSYEEVPVSTYEEAQDFAQTEWAKIRRDNGHEIELKCIGNIAYKPAWVHVKLYSYPVDMWMYIKAGSHEITETGEFNTNLTLVDYPPSLGEFNETDSDEETEEEEETTDSEEET